MGLPEKCKEQVGTFLWTKHVLNNFRGQSVFISLRLYNVYNMFGHSNEIRINKANKRLSPRELFPVLWEKLSCYMNLETSEKRQTVL